MIIYETSQPPSNPDEGQKSLADNQQGDDPRDSGSIRKFPFKEKANNTESEQLYGHYF
jgi:hypothetical protein